MTFRASGPFCPSDGSNSTFAPSVRVLKPSPAIALKWTNTSLPPASGVMKPYPFASLNHLTVPVAIEKHLLYLTENGQRRRELRNRYSLVYARTVARIRAIPLFTREAGHSRSAASAIRALLYEGPCGCGTARTNSL